MDDTSVNEHGRVPVKLHLQKQGVGRFAGPWADSWFRRISRISLSSAEGIYWGGGSASDTGLGRAKFREQSASGSKVSLHLFRAVFVFLGQFCGFLHEAFAHLLLIFAHLFFSLLWIIFLIFFQLALAGKVYVFCIFISIWFERFLSEPLFTLIIVRWILWSGTVRYFPVMTGMFSLHRPA